MPTYSYQCVDCGFVTNIIQKMTDSHLDSLDCEECNKKTNVKRIIVGGSGMIFKGSGFYLTDYTEDGEAPEKPIKSNSKENKEKKKKKKD